MSTTIGAILLLLKDENVKADAPKLTYAVRVSPRKEFIAQQLLTADGHSVYLPLEVALRCISKRDRRREWLKGPMLTGYIFTIVSASYELERLFQWSFVRSVVGEPPSKEYPDGIPKPIPEHAMAIIREESEKRCQIPAPPVNWHPNRSEWANITSGPYEGRRMIVEEIRGRKARRFLGCLEGSGLKVEVGIEQLEPA